ncbi:DHH family phosphoesterase [Methylotuvimicrobium alcaliphilum]|uniref:Acetyltransferase n=1 Tax=Methylotuvimicrobium alcaliphilum (strain DSM 19304 / NCIMB 14124 / VKM B-2133 / 20Z) TaxID=1091494 RepID=G4SZI7_META2|nr:DHH family phosphoesterase [Methylotuvimicrobium alcaliphilum]CCE24428.1 Acetyltransferase [Methylotuvimicrobium alcaliphilum 20Z]
MRFDVFNGDADGICALIQLRLAEPADALLVTGIKRDIDLLERVDARAGDKVLVLDISLEKNLLALQRILDQGAEVFYVDHHRPGDIPDHTALTALIDTDANVCTSLLVDRFLQGRYREWAITAAFGDNLDQPATQLANELSLSEAQTEQLKQLGVCINYNGYGSCIKDLHFPPGELYLEMAGYSSPFDFINDKAVIYNRLSDGYNNDLAHAKSIASEYSTTSVAVYILPDEAWARRISGVFANELANAHPDRAHAILSHNRSGGYLVSVRAPHTHKTGADELCAMFPTGGGRKAAAGINHLPIETLPQFIDRFETHYSSFR